MNKLFRNEFSSLDANKIKEIVNRCAGQDILQNDIVQTIKNANNLYYIKYIENEDYGFWNIQWGWKNNKFPMPMGGFFEYGIKITPFKLEFENTSSQNPYCKPHNRKQLEEYIQLFINKYCPHYKQAILEETEKFIKFLDI